MTVSFVLLVIISRMLLPVHKPRNVPSLFLQQLIHLSPYWYWEFWPAVTSHLFLGSRSPFFLLGFLFLQCRNIQLPLLLFIEKLLECCLLLSDSFLFSISILSSKDHNSISAAQKLCSHFTC